MDYSDMIQKYNEEIDEIFCEKMHINLNEWFNMTSNEQELLKENYPEHYLDSVEEQRQYLCPEVDVYD